MPTVLLTRTLIADIKNQRTGDYLEVACIDPNEQNIAKLTRLLGKALQETMTLKVLELAEPSPELVTLVAHALNRPRCRLEALVLKGMKKPGLAEISLALSHVSPNDITMSMAGVVGTSCHALIITFSATPFSVMKLTRTQIHQFSVLGLPILAAPSQEALPDVAFAQMSSLASRQPVLGDHSLSLSSSVTARWGNGDPVSSRERVRPQAPLVDEGFEEDKRQVKLSLPFTVPWNAWLNSTSHVLAHMPLLDLPDGESDSLSLPSLPLVTDTPSPSECWYLAPPTPPNASIVATVKPQATLASENRAPSRLSEDLSIEAANLLPVIDSPARQLLAFKPKTALSAPVSSLTSAFSSMRASADLDVVPIASTSVGVLRHRHYFSKMALDAMSRAP